MYTIRVVKEGFMIGSQHHEVGSELKVPKHIHDYMVQEQLGETVGDMTGSGYVRRDMKAEKTPSKRKKLRKVAKDEVQTSLED